MFSREFIWFSSFAVLSCIWMVVAWRTNPQHAIGITFALSLLVPSWVELEIAGNPFPVRIASIAFALLGYCFHPRAIFPWRLGVIDMLMLSILAVHCLSDTWNSGWSWTIVLRAYCEWGIPYIAGRLALSETYYLRSLVNCFCVVATLIAFLAVIEGVSHLHPWEYVFGERPLDGIPRDAQRWGVLRTWGQSKHPIFLGLLLVAFAPWFLFRFDMMKKSVSGRTITIAMLAVVLCGIATTGSRAAVIAFLGTVLFNFSCYSRVLRWGMVICTIGFVIFCAANWDGVVKGLHVWSGEERIERSDRLKITIDDQVMETSSTMGRLNLFAFYRRAMWEGGLLGFGTERTTGFPVQVPVGDRDSDARNQLRFVDNAYILITLRFGWCGLTLFSLLMLYSSFQSWVLQSLQFKLANSPSSPSQFMSAAIFWIAIALFTVWLAYDFSYFLLFTIGTSSIPGYSQQESKW